MVHPMVWGNADHRESFWGRTDITTARIMPNATAAVSPTIHAVRRDDRRAGGACAPGGRNPAVELIQGDPGCGATPGADAEGGEDAV